MSEMTHKAAVRRISDHLRNSRGYKIVVAELVTASPETADVLAFRGGAHSMLVEVKVSRADFLADRQKSFRVQMERGMGDLRYFAAPKGMLLPEEMPDKWGLLEIDERCIRERKEAETQPADKRRECVVLMSALRRVEISTAVFVRQEPDSAEPSSP